MDKSSFPYLIPITRNIFAPVLKNPETLVAEQLKTMPSPPAGSQIAIAVGSRGIDNLVPVLKAILDWLHASGAKPFVIAAMGSHGGGTVEGQLSVLESYGVRADALGVPVVASTDTISFRGSPYDGDIFITKEAWEADGIIILNRVKKHTDIQDSIQSGLCKMIAIGLGNRQQAEILHNEGLDTLSASIPLIASSVIASKKILLGVALVENLRGQTAIAEVIPPESLIQREKELLKESDALSVGLPVDTLDVLVIDEGGKNYAGSCIDTNVIGRMRLEGERDLDTPNIHRVVVCDLSDHSQGNAAGIGLADFITRRFYQKIDFPSTNTNCISCIFPERGKIPMVMENSGSALATALQTCRSSARKEPRIIRIHDTLNLERMYVSSALLDEISEREEITILGPPRAMVDTDGELVPFERWDCFKKSFHPLRMPKQRMPRYLSGVIHKVCYSFS